MLKFVFTVIILLCVIVVKLLSLAPRKWGSNLSMALSTTLFNNFGKFYNTIINKLINALILYFYYL